jgi:class 3 adenylate cyclase/tetratricopeptide (TPR) repeat protein
LSNPDFEAITAQRRQLTVLFCDIVGSTELSQELDPEDLRDLMALYTQVCTEAVLAHEGHVAQYLGDGVVVYFGFPIAHEDDAQRAVRCGLDILQASHNLQTTRGISPGSAFDVRLGIHTGRVLVDSIAGGARKDLLALGDTPNLAARIQNEATPGSLAVSESTWKIVQDYFTGSSLGERRLKGVASPIRLWLVDARAQSAERVEVARSLTPFVGRHEERAALAVAWSEARTAHRRFVLVRGEPGIGKSRLARQFWNDIGSEAATRLIMRASPYNTGSPFNPVIELLRSSSPADFALSPSEQLDVLEHRLEEYKVYDPEAPALLASLLGIPSGMRYPELRMSPRRRRSRIMRVFIDLVTGIAANGPTLLVIEDLHWADSATIELVENWLTLPPDVALLGLITTRPEFDPPWSQTPSVETIELRRLDRGCTEQMVRAVASGRALPNNVVRQLVSRSEGVPLFVEALTHNLLDWQMVDEWGDSREAASVLPGDAIPPTVDASLTSRVDRLGTSRPTAQLAAAIGREFSVSLLRSVSDRDPAILDRDLDRLVRFGLARTISGDGERMAFTHALIRDAAYSSLLRTTRQSYHSRIAAALREGVTRSTDRPDLIANHLTMAGEDAAAVTFWEAAGRQAVVRGSVLDAAEHFRRAIDCIRRLPVDQASLRQELELQGQRVPLLMAVYGWASCEVEDACVRLLDLAQQLDRPPESYAALWGLWTVRFLRGELAPATEASEQVLDRALASGSRLFAVTGHHATSYTYLYGGDFPGALTQAEAGLALFDFEQEKALVETFSLSSSVCLRTCRSTALWMLGRLTEAVEEGRRMVSLARELHHLPSLAAGLAFALHLGGHRYSYTGEMDRLAATTDELLALCRDEDFLMWYAVACTYKGIIEQANGNYREARAMIGEGLDLFEQTRSRLTLVLMNVLCAEAFIRMGDDDMALDRLDIAEVERGVRMEGLFASEVPRVRAGILARRGSISAAESLYREALALARSQQARPLELRAAVDLYELQMKQGRVGESRQHLNEILSEFGTDEHSPEIARAASHIRAVS